MVSITDEQIAAGQAVYTPRTLRVYDFVVLGVSNRLIWKCPTSRLLKHYNAHVTDNHLDVGVGSGYFPDRCRFPSSSPRVGLMDLNADALDFAAKRIQRYDPETYRCDILQPLSLDGKKFDSVAVNYVLHCLPGSMSTKAVVFDHLAELLNPGGVLFGSTLLHGGVRRGWAAKRLMAFYNRKGIFSNADDGFDDLDAQLAVRFESYQTRVIGSVALFSGRLS
ncbi:class I SAM-dependent methyltransferase [Roseimaritima ulvae]|uniref:Methyltransferase domain protein n=1 Tax=Roseimaritima ulvae TaxID=980254 RepID=A0A5B9QS63_9BACT|nr:class I SAM-dependent methyltransferase [Roseimaritima ulvae]QEG41888.1 Methyltransferase domain protein [Roseimaritima ulvae]